MMLQGKEHEKADAFVDGDIGAVAKLKDVQTGDLLADSEREHRGRRSSTSPSR